MTFDRWFGVAVALLDSGLGDYLYQARGLTRPNKTAEEVNIEKIKARQDWDKECLERRLLLASAVARQMEAK
jgi:hypothetical protein